MRSLVASASLLLVVLSMGCSGGAGVKTAQNEVIPASQARQHTDSVRTVELTVKASKHEADKHIYYLDSETDYKDVNNLAVVIAETDMDKFRSQQINDPAEHYKGKTIRVTGKIVFNDDQYQIWIKNPSEIQVVEAK